MEELTVRPRQEIAATADTDQARAIAEVQAAMVIARRFPRDVVRARDRILDACTRPRLAEAALYEYARGGTAITGPSIRLAEAIAQAFGNLTFGVRELDQRDGVSTVEAYAWDMESNVRQTKTFQVKHTRYTRKGSTRLEDPRDIYEMTANQGARRLRACILGVVPGDIIDEAVAQCEETLRAKADVTPERVAAMVQRFADLGVTRQQIERRIQRRVDAITPGQMVLLGKVYNSLKDGMSVPADWFEADSPAEPAPTLAEKIRKPRQANAKGPSVASEAETCSGTPTKAKDAPAAGIPCPNRDGAEVPAETCETCGDRDGCPSREGGAA